MHLSPVSSGLGCCLFDDFDRLFIVAPIVCAGFYAWCLIYDAVLSVISSFVVILMGKRELVA